MLSSYLPKCLCGAHNYSERVFAIQVTSPKPFYCEGIAKATKRDNVTFVADDHWQPWDAKEAKSIEVHAWNEEKFIAYFGWIMWDLGQTAGRKLEQPDDPVPA